jgi:hypothetical protein
MQFESANPSVVRSIKQRELLNAWIRTRATPRPRPLPHVRDYKAERFADEISDMMGFDVDDGGDEVRFLITQEGPALAVTYGSEAVDPAKRTNRYLDDAIGPERYARVLPPYRACLAHRRPTYSISTVQDADGKDVAYERLLLPFGAGDAVEQIVGSYKTISIEGGFKRNNLMGLRPMAVPVSVVNVVIDLDFVGPARGASDDVIELD